jgi:hypothetical protein
MWFAGMIFAGAGLLARHVVALPTPAADARLGSSLQALRLPAEQGRWLAVHVLYADCRCSQRIKDHLLSRSRPSDFAEIVLWVGGAIPADLAARFDVRRVAARDLASYGIEAAPLLVALDPEGHVRYAGGYTTRKQGPKIEDRELLEASRSATRPEALPLFGCAVSDRLKRELSNLPAP